jgi:small-conductance mechanosensitive channel
MQAGNVASALIEHARRWMAATDFVELSLRVALGLGAAIIVYLGLSRALKLVGRRLSAQGAGSEATAQESAILRAFGRAIAHTSALFLLVIALASGGALLPLAPSLRAMLHSTFVIGFVLQATIWTGVALAAWLESLSAGASEDRRALASATAIIGTLARLALWAIATLLILDNLGFNITTLIAGLGIGGIAVGLAAQKILGDLFASLAILLDKPFEYGDFIVAGSHMGTVERIGLKTTRLRSLSGEQLVIANADLLESRIQNFKRMGERRVVFKLRVVYGTPAGTLRAIPPMVRAAIEAQKQVRFERSHIASYEDSAIIVESAYYVLSADYNLYMDTHQAILLAIYEGFARKGVRFALPPGNGAESAAANADAPAATPAPGSAP